jgi:acetyl-CoA carboxylase carboxyltransferase component
MDKIKILDQNSDRILKASVKIRAFLDDITEPKSLVETDVFLAGNSFVDGTDALGEGVVTGYAVIGGAPVYFFAQNAEVLSGSLSVAGADKIVKNIYAAEKAGVPFVSIIDSAGARIGEGIGVCEGFAKLIKAANDVSGSIPHIAVVKGNCVGLMSAYAGAADFVLADANAAISANSPSVAVAVSKASADALSAKNTASKSGAAAYVYTSTDDLKEKLSSLLNILPSNGSYTAAGDYTDDLNRESEKLNSDASFGALLEAVADDGEYFEVYPDYAKEVRCALGKIAGISVAFTGFDPDENKYITLNGLKKLSKFIYAVSGLNVPHISFVDSKGIEASVEGEYNGIAAAASALAADIAASENVKIAVVTGNAIGFAYAALASKAIGFDYTFATVNGIISPINPETAAVLIGDGELRKSKDPIVKREELIKKYADEAANPYIAAKNGYIDNIIEPSLIRQYVASVLLMLTR